jgi:hypothetical protein
VGYLVKNSIIDGVYFPIITNQSNMAAASLKGGGCIYQIFNNTVSISGNIDVNFDVGTINGAFRLNLPNNLTGSLTSLCKGVYSPAQTNNITILTITPYTVDLNNPILFTCNTSLAGSGTVIAFIINFSL